jgi:hypothetical protein
MKIYCATLMYDRHYDYETVAHVNRNQLYRRIWARMLSVYWEDYAYDKEPEDWLRVRSALAVGRYDVACDYVRSNFLQYDDHTDFRIGTSVITVSDDVVREKLADSKASTVHTQAT